MIIDTLTSRSTSQLTVHRICVVISRRCSSSTDAPRITSGPRDQRVIDNGIASFICRATGNPVPEIYWRRTSGGRRVTYSAVGGSSTGSSSASPSGGGGGGGSGRQQVRYTAIVVPTSVHSMASSASVGSVLRVDPVKAQRGDDDSDIECIADNGVGEPAVASARLQIYPIDGHSKLLMARHEHIDFLKYVRVLLSKSKITFSMAIRRR